jgi:hypothetical protein
MAPCVLAHQQSFVVEQFCHEIAERLCIEAGEKKLLGGYFPYPRQRCKLLMVSFCPFLF